jgi:hypothetical protein
MKTIFKIVFIRYFFCLILKLQLLIGKLYYVSIFMIDPIANLKFCLGNKTQFANP